MLRRIIPNLLSPIVGGEETFSGPNNDQLTDCIEKRQFLFSVGSTPLRRERFDLQHLLIYHLGVNFRGVKRKPDDKGGTTIRGALRLNAAAMPLNDPVDYGKP